MSSKAKSKKPTEDDDPDAEETVPSKTSSRKNVAAVPPKKKAKAESKPEVDEDDDGEQEDEPDEEPSPEEQDKIQKALTKKRKKAKLVGYRSLSKVMGCLLSEADAKRLMRNVPSTPGAPGLSSNEFSRRLKLYKNGVPASAARETQARSDVVMRAAMNEAVLRSVESGKKTVSASTMASVLRRYASNMEFTAVVPPLGLVRYAQEIGILNPSSEEEMKKRGDEKKEILANKRSYYDFIESKEKERAAKREKKSAAQAAALASVTSE